MRRLFRKRRLLLVICAVSVAAVGWRAYWRRPRWGPGDVGVEVTQEHLCTIDDRAIRDSYAYSLPGSRFAYVTLRSEREVEAEVVRRGYTGRRPGDKEAVVINDAEQSWYDEVYKPVATNLDWHKVLYHPPVEFSPDGQRYAYAARSGEKWFAVIDGVEGKAYDQIVEGRIVFSIDGRSYAYVARQDERDCVVVDAVEGARYESVDPHSLRYGPGNRLAYVALTGEYEIAVVDGVETGRFERIGYIAFSGDGQHYAYAACRGKGSFIVVDGNVVRRSHAAVSYEQAAGRYGTYWVWVSGHLTEPRGQCLKVALNHDGSQLACVATSPATGKSHVELNGLAGPEFRSVSELQFTRAGRLLYSAVRSRKYFVVFNGRQFGPHAGVSGVAASPEGRHMAFVAYIPPSFIATGISKAKNWLGRSQRSRPRTGAKAVSDRGCSACSYWWPRGSFFFSADGGQLGYVANSESGWRLFVDHVDRQQVPAAAAVHLDKGANTQSLWKSMSDGAWRFLIVNASREVHLVDIRFREAPSSAGKP